jgi:hypothetical protein
MGLNCKAEQIFIMPKNAVSGKDLLKGLKYGLKRLFEQVKK